MLEAGIKGQHTIIVEKENTAAVMKSSIRNTGNDRPDRGDRMEECCR